MGTNIVILTGAGISAESGIPTFRASDGLWENHRVDDVATPAGFKKDPALVHRFYNERRAALKTVQPNAAHIALAELEQGWRDGGFLLVTQNVDDLHERGGSKNIAHIHGELKRIKCVSCAHEEVTELDTSVDTACQKCSLPMRPDVVWFGEMPHYLDVIEQVLDVADVFISIGTSGQVQPANLFATAVKMANPNAVLIEVNLNPTGESTFTRSVQGPAATTLPLLVKELLATYQS